jgi:hypothetical protein
MKQKYKVHDTQRDDGILYLFPSGCVIIMSKSPQEAFPRLNDPPQTMIAFKKDIKRVA